MGETKGGTERGRVQPPDFPRHHDAATRTGHGGGGFFTAYHFARAIRTQTPPWLDVYRGVDMSIVGVQARPSALADSASMEVPDFRRRSVRRRFKRDHWSPDPARAGEGQPPSSIGGQVELSQEARRLALEVWQSRGYVAPGS